MLKKKVKKDYFDEIVGKFVDKFIFLKDFTESDDYVRNYGQCCIFLTILLLQLKDTTKEGGGDRNLINQKLMLTIFKSFST